MVANSQRRTCSIGHQRLCSCLPSHINCLTAKEWIQNQLGVWQFYYEARDIRDKELHPATFPIILVGLVFRRKHAFRSRALAVVGAAVGWDDLRDRSADDREAVRELTARIDKGLRRVTLNLEQWQDRPLVECAEAIWASEWEATGGAADTVARLAVSTDVLARIRQDPDPRWSSLIRDILTHCRRLKRLHLRPGDLATDVRVRTSVRWGVRRLHLIGFPAFVVAVAGYALFWPPYRITGMITTRLTREHDLLATYNLIVGILIYGVWMVALTVAAAWLTTPLGALATLMIAPAVGLTGLWVRERWWGSWRDIRRFFLLRSRQTLIETLQERQRRIAHGLRELHAKFVAGGK